MRSLLAVFLLMLSGHASGAFSLTVTKSGTGVSYGSVYSVPAGIDCGQTCTASFEPGTQVTLYGTGGGYNNTVSFSGDCFGYSCTLTMDSAKTVNVNFNYYVDPVLVSIPVFKSGSGTGKVRAQGVECISACGPFYMGNSATLTATADPGSVFAGWSGSGCEGIHTCTLVAGSSSVTATFDVGTPTPRPVNVSTRGRVETGFGVMIGGFVINGVTEKTIVVRAIGPSLQNHGIADALENPTLQLVRVSDNAVIASTDDWGSGADAARLRAVGLQPGHSLESAVIVTIPAGPGAYTAIVSGVNGGVGVGLVEVFEVDDPGIPIINLSTRGTVQAGAGVMIGGFVILDGMQTVVIRAIGPSLANFGVAGALANPTMQLVRINDNSVVATNDDWGSAPNASQIMALSFAPSNPLESAILVTLGPGAYTAVVSGAGGTTGVGLVEIYRVTP